MKKILVLLLLLSLAALLYWWFAQQNGDQQQAHSIYKVQRGDINASIDAIGDISALELVDVGAQVTGQIQSFMVQIGDKVERGQLLASIESSAQRAHLAQAQSALASAQAQLQIATANLSVANSNYQRERELATSKATSTREVELAKRELDSRQAELGERRAAIKAAKIAVAIAKTNLGFTKIVAPLQGTVVSTSVRAGQSINSAQSSPTLVQIANLQQMLLRVQVSEADVGKLAVGQDFSFTTLADSTVYRGKIASIDPGLTIMSRGAYSANLDLSNSAIYYFARATIDNSAAKLQIGMTAHVKIITASRHNVLLIPAELIEDYEGSTAVRERAANAEGFVWRKLKLGISDALHSEVIEGLQEGAELISSSAPIAPTGKKPAARLRKR